MSSEAPAEVPFSITPSAVRASDAERKRQVEAPFFGQYFSDHMAHIRWNSDVGWHDAQIRPLSPLDIHPGAMIFHYGQSIFEGLKAYRAPDGRVLFFRPALNAARLNRSAERMAMPTLPPQTFLEACELLTRIDDSWIPSKPGRSLYLRPLMFASEVHLGVRAAEQYDFIVIASPVEPFFVGDIRAISVFVPETEVRAALGGTGEAKCAGNYAASLRTRLHAKQMQCDEVLWLDAAEHRFIEELSGMNFFAVDTSGTQPVLLTPPLTGTLLDGITRSSILDLGAHLGYETRQEPITLTQFREGCRRGTITEAFACGTAAVVAPIGRVICSDKTEWTVGDGEPGPATSRLRETLLSIQEGRSVDTFGWTHAIGQGSF